MARNASKLARALGAKIVGKVPETGGGAFGAARLAAILHDRLTPGSGRRPGRPTDPSWVKHSKVPMTQETFKALKRLARRLSTSERRISPMQVAAQLLEDSVGELLDEQSGTER